MLISQRSQQDSGEQREKFSPWSAYSDMYCSLLLIFMLLFFFAILNYLEVQEENTEKTASIQNELTAQLSAQADTARELSMAQAEIDFYQTELSDKDASLSALQQNLDQNALALEDARQEAQAQAARIQSLEDALSLANQFLSEAQQLSARQEADAAAESADLREQLADRDRQIEALNGQLKRAEAASDTLTAQAADLGAENARLSSDLRETRENADSLTAQIADLNGENARLSSDLREARENADSLTVQNAALSASLEETRAQIAAQRKTLAELQNNTTVQTQAARIDELEKELADTAQYWQAQADSAARDNQSLSAQIITLQAENEQLTQSAAAAVLVQDTLSSQLAESERLKTLYYNQSRETADQLLEQTGKIRQAEALASAAAEEKNQYAAQIVDLNARIAALEGEVLSLQNVPLTRVRTSREVAELTEQIMARLTRALGDAGVPYILGANGDSFIFQADELFYSGSTDLNKAGRGRMDEFFPLFLQSLLGDPEADSIRTISFVAYEKDAGSYGGKMNLAVNRAVNALRYCYGQMETQSWLQASKREWLQEVLSVGGHVIEKGEDSPAESDSFVEVAFTLWYNK